MSSIVVETHFGCLEFAYLLSVQVWENVFVTIFHFIFLYKRLDQEK